MKVYTEVSYIWKDNKLVQTESKSYDYEGEVTKCDSRRGGPSWARYNIPHSHWVPPTVADIPSTADLADAASTNLGNAADAAATNMAYARDKILQIASGNGAIGKIQEEAAGLIGEGSDDSDNPLYEDTSPGSRATGAGMKSQVGGSQSNLARRGINKKNAPSLINQQMQKRLYA